MCTDHTPHSVVWCRERIHKSWVQLIANTRGCFLDFWFNTEAWEGGKYPGKKPVPFSIVSYSKRMFISLYSEGYILGRIPSKHQYYIDLGLLWCHFNIMGQAETWTRIIWTSTSFKAITLTDLSFTYFTSLLWG